MRARLLLLTGSLLFTFAVLEVGLRLVERWTSVDFFHVMRTPAQTPADGELRLRDLIRLSEHPELIFELAPGRRGRFQGAEVRINDAGFRGPAPSVGEGSRALRRVVGLGDSNMFGWGVGEAETFLARLERLAAEAFPGAPRLEVLNLAVPGYNTHQEVESLVRRGLAFEPDWVVLFACDNDAALAHYVRHRPPLWTLERSYLVDLVEVRAKLWLRGERFRNRHLGRGLGRPAVGFDEAAEPARVPPEYRHSVGPDAVRAALDRLARLAEQDGFRVVYAQLEPAGELTRAMAQQARALGFQVVDVASRVEERLADGKRELESLLLSREDRHPNAEYHALIARAIFEDAIAPSYAAVPR